MRFLWAIGLAALTVAWGCGKGKQPSARLSKVVESQEKEITNVSDDEISPKEPDKTEVEAKSKAPVKPKRILFLTPGGPLVADVFLSIAGRSHDEILQEQVQRMLAAADTNGDGKATWKEWQENEEFFEEETSGYNLRRVKQWGKEYDQNYDKKMQPVEAISWLGRDNRGSVRAFSLRSRKSYHANLSSASHVWQLLDVDRDDWLSEDEIRSSANRLWQFDADDDRTITSNELATLEEQLEAAGGRRLRRNYVLDRHAAIQLDSDFDLDSLDSLLSDMYAPRQYLSRNSFSDLPSLFDTLDIDRNDQLDGDELAELLKIDPMVKISVSYFDAKEDHKPPTVELESNSDVVLLSKRNSCDRGVILLGKTRLMVSAHDLSMDDENSSALQATQIRLMVHDQGDALFREIDSNDDGRLGEREISTCAERMMQYDANGDGQLAVEEFPYPMIVAFLRGERKSERSFYTPEMSAEKILSEGVPPWFEQADFNSDGDLSRREFLGPNDRFESLDLNDDGYIDSAEAASYSRE